MKLASCKRALNSRPTAHIPPAVVYSTDRSKAVVVPVLVLFFVALWFILRGGFFCFVILFLSF